MLSSRQKFKLMLTYTRPALIVSGLGSIAAFMLWLNVSVESLFDAVTLATVLKILIIAIVNILFRMLVSKDSDYFYINIGIHPRILLRWSILLDTTVYIAGAALIILLRNVIAG